MHNEVSYEAFTSPPIWDKDDWAFNYVGHPIAGSYYYNSVRSQNATWLESFLFATFQSCVWEYVIEGLAERPSIQDLIVTPIGGVIIGEPIHILNHEYAQKWIPVYGKSFCTDI